MAGKKRKLAERERERERERWSLAKEGPEGLQIRVELRERPQQQAKLAPAHSKKLAFATTH